MQETKSWRTLTLTASASATCAKSTAFCDVAVVCLAAARAAAAADMAADLATWYVAIERCAASKTSDAERTDDEDDLADDEDDLADDEDNLANDDEDDLADDLAVADDDLADDEDALADDKDARGGAKGALCEIEGVLADSSIASASLRLAPIPTCPKAWLRAALSLEAAPLSEAMPSAAALPTGVLLALCRSTFVASFASGANDIFFVPPLSSTFNRFCCSGVYLQRKNHNLQTIQDANPKLAKSIVIVHCSVPSSHAL
jgi:hypothetical protein